MYEELTEAYEHESWGGNVEPNIGIASLDGLARILSKFEGLPFECARCRVLIRLEDAEPITIDGEVIPLQRYAPGKSS